MFVLASTATAAPVAATSSVTIVGFAFSPATVTINVGDSVRWTNNDAAPHSARRTGTGAFDTGTLSQGQSGTVIFNAAGSFGYICGIHGSSMSGTVVVQGAATPTPQPTPVPTPAPTVAPTVAPTRAPTAAPTDAATPVPTVTVPASSAAATATTAPTTAATLAVAATTPPATAQVATATSDGLPGPVLVGAGAIVVLALVGTALVLLRR